MKEKKQKKLSIDAKILSDVVIELNISRRNTGLYPPEHPILKESINRAFELLKKLFELRGSISLGIAKDALIIDEYILDSNNSVFQEFALSLHIRGIASITFYNGIEIEELVFLNELITSYEGIKGKALLEIAEKKGLGHISLRLVDLSSFRFVKGPSKPGTLESNIWEDYIYGLLEGRLSDKDVEDVIIHIPPDQIALFINSQLPADASEETYDRLISAYLRKTGQLRLCSETLERFLLFVKNLKPEIKNKFLRMLFSQFSFEPDQIKWILAKLKDEEIQRLIDSFKEQSLKIPENLKNIIDKFTELKSDSKFGSDLKGKGKSLVDDIEIDEKIVSLLEDRPTAFVSERYKRELEMMIKGLRAEKRPMSEDLNHECSERVVDSTNSEIMLEILGSDYISSEDCLNLLTKLSEIANTFLETGRFQELCDIYNALYTHSLSGRFKIEASSMVNYFFRSEQFILRLIKAFKLWGRFDRKGAARLARGIKLQLINPMFDALSEESDLTIRKFFLYLLATFGSDIIPEAVSRLNDNRWYVVRNMICLIRECVERRYQKQYINQIKQFARHKNKKVCMEALKTLLHFDTPDASSYLKLYLKSKDEHLRYKAIVFSGIYKVKDAVQDLIELLEKKDYFGSESHYKVSIIRALADIGDPSAIEPLKMLYTSKGLFFKDSLEKVKTEIFKTLHNYPPYAIKPLLKLGIKSKNEEIRNISINLVEAYNKWEVLSV